MQEKEELRSDAGSWRDERHSREWHELRHGFMRKRSKFEIVP
jgi:hypothetical protein